MPYEYNTLGDLLSHPGIRPVAADAIRGLDLKAEPVWNDTLAQISGEHIFAGDIGLGIERLYAASETGDWFFPLWEDDPGRANLVWFPSSAPGADDRPFLLLVPGGGFVNVWNLTEGWPVAARFNRLGYHVFILTYLVQGTEDLLRRNMEDFAAALRLIASRREHFHVRADRYLTCGFSAGGYLVCLWNTRLGYPAFGLPKPQGTVPVYPVVTLKPPVRYGSPDPAEAVRLYGCSLREAAASDFEIPEHVEGFPPCALFLAAEDELVDPENSRMLARALDAAGIPCRLEIGEHGGHGFADGTGMCMEGWPDRAVRWLEGESE